MDGSVGYRDFCYLAFKIIPFLIICSLWELSQMTSFRIWRSQTPPPPSVSRASATFRLPPPPHKGRTVGFTYKNFRLRRASATRQPGPDPPLPADVICESSLIPLSVLPPQEFPEVKNSTISGDRLFLEHCSFDCFLVLTIFERTLIYILEHC